MTNKIFIPAIKPEDWRPLLADDKHWKPGHSAKALAYCWQEANGFPKSVRDVFKNSKIELFKDVELVLAFPEYQVPLPPYDSHSSQNDIFILAKGKGKLVSIMVEGKVSESFGKPVTEWLSDNSKGKHERLKFLCEKLELSINEVDSIQYQLLHRTASAILEAEKFNAESALMLVHSFSQFDEWFGEYKEFLALFDIKGIAPNYITFAKNIKGVDLYFCWIRGDKKYLDK